MEIELIVAVVLIAIVILMRLFKRKYIEKAPTQNKKEETKLKTSLIDKKNERIGCLIILQIVGIIIFIICGMRYKLKMHYFILMPIILIITNLAVALFVDHKLKSAPKKSSVTISAPPN